MAQTVFTEPALRAGGFLVSEAEDNRSRENIIILSGQDLKPGHVLGKVLVGAAAAAVAASGNTGNGAMGAITVSQAARLGSYQLVIIEPGADAGTFELANPDGVIVGRGTVGAAFTGAGLAFTLADGSADFVAGDRLTINITGGTEKYKEYNPANTDGSQVPAAICWGRYDATDGDVRGAAVVRDAQVNELELTWFSGATSGQKAAAAALMRNEPMRVIVRPAI